MIEALEPLTVFTRAHIDQWRGLKLLTTDLDIYNGVSKPQELRLTSPPKPWKEHPY